MKISVITPIFTIAGVPLAQVRFARALARRGHDVDLVIGWIDPAHLFPDVSDINVIDLDKRQVRNMLQPLRTYLRSARPDVVFSAEDHLNAVVLLAAITTSSRAKISCSSRVTPFDTYSDKWMSKRWLLKQFMRAVMWRADALTCVSQGTVEEYRKIFASPRHVCVYNSIDDTYSRSRIQEAVEHEWFRHKECPVLVAAGRLAPWKGYADLIHAVKELSLRRRVRLMILGDGPLRCELQSLVSELGLSDVVSLLGYVENPLKYFAHADIFVHSAHVESLGNVLVEAMMCGLTVVSTDCPTGPREVLQSGKYGYLVPMRDPVAMAAGIETALHSPILNQRLEEAVRPFEEGAVIRRHFEVLGLSENEAATRVTL